MGVDMSNFDRILKIVNSDDPAQIIAENKQICRVCGEAVAEFTNEEAEFKYHISALCERCQDIYE